MLYVVTGVPGAGKTSNTLDDLIFSKSYASRPKFVLNVRGFDFDKAPNCAELTRQGLEDWKNLPPDSIVVIDEAYDFFPKSGAGSAIPEWIKDLAKHRHYGIDFYLIAQNASMLHHHIRQLVEQHIHYNRIGKKKTGRYTWPRLQTNVDAKQARAEAEWRLVSANPRIFQLYESTVLDTSKSRLPWARIAFIVVGLLVAAGLFFRVFNRFYAEPESTPEAAMMMPAVANASPYMGQVIGPAPVRPRTVSDYVPRNALDPSSAPIYDHLTQPTDFPRIAACMQGTRKVCKCFTQQATPVRIPEDVCESMIKTGWFDNSKTGRAYSQMQAAGQPGPAQPAQPVRPVEPVRSAPLESAGWSSTPVYRSDLLHASGWSRQAGG